MRKKIAQGPRCGIDISLILASFLLLLLIPVDGKRPDPRRFIAAIATLGILVAGPMLVGPASHWQRFFSAIPDAGSLGEGNPGALGLATALALRAGASTLDATRIATLTWSGYAIFVMAISV